ncbi:MAG: peptide chain release factor 1 [Candidatus Moranbacteria bacterium]|nr:peptide chain release factor 1 [Candidatus Moranbacteria bacterium]
MLEKFEQYKKKLSNLEVKMQDPEVVSNPNKMAQIGREHAEVSQIIKEFETLENIQHQLEEAKSIIRNGDSEILAMAEEEVENLTKLKTEQVKRVEAALIPKDPNDSKNVILEIRAGAGGDEAALFANELYRMYFRFAEHHKMQIDVMNSSPSEGGGLKEIIAEIKGPDAYKLLKHESGVHRVQRVPVTESQGRVHTSTVTVAILPEAEEVDIEIKPSDIRIDIFRSSGPGGQSVNTTDSAVRITHLETGVVVTCQDEKSQLKNKDKAMKILRSRLLAAKEEEEAKKRGDARKSQIGTGDRSEKIRTYNFPQDRITDHRIKFSTSNIPKFMDGYIDDMIQKLLESEQEKKLKNS